jgi:hypothetical protein
MDHLQISARAELRGIMKMLAFIKIKLTLDGTRTKLAAGIHWYLDPTSPVEFLPTYFPLMDQCG